MPVSQAALLAPLASLASAPLPPLAWQRRPPAWDAAITPAAIAIVGVVLLVWYFFNVIFLRLAAVMITRERFDFGAACVTVLLYHLAAGAITFVLGLGIGFVVGLAGGPLIAGPFINLILGPVVFFLSQSAIVSSQHDLSFGQAALITLMMFLLWIALGFVAFLLFVAGALAILGIGK